MTKTPIGPLLHLVPKDPTDLFEMDVHDQHVFLRIVCSLLCRKQGVKAVDLKTITEEADVPLEIAFVAMLALSRRGLALRDKEGYKVTAAGWQFYYAHLQPPTL